MSTTTRLALFSFGWEVSVTATLDTMPAIYKQEKNAALELALKTFFNFCKSNFLRFGSSIRRLSVCYTKQIKWSGRPSKTQISLVIRIMWPDTLLCALRKHRISIQSLATIGSPCSKTPFKWRFAAWWAEGGSLFLIRLLATSHERSGQKKLTKLTYRLIRVFSQTGSTLQLVGFIKYWLN